MPDTLRQFKANIFQALAHPTRIAIVEVLRDGELPAGAIIERLGLEQANASQHFSILRAKQIVNSRKEGNQVFYSVRDPLLIEVLDIMRRYFQAHVEEAMSMLQQIDLLDKESTQVTTAHTIGILTLNRRPAKSFHDHLLNLRAGHGCSTHSILPRKRQRFCGR